MARIICVDCEIPYRPDKNGVIVKTMFNDNKEVYQIWEADRLICPGCSKKVICGLGRQPIAEHFEKHFSGLSLKIAAKVPEENIHLEKEILKD